MTEWEKLTYKKFSIGHPDKQTMIPENNFQGKLYYTFFKNSPQKTIDEIYDIYFGKFFHAKTKRGTTVSWGNVMGVEASDMALDWLFRVQEDFGIPLSLTMNQLNVPFDLYNDEDVVKQFIDWVGEFYNRGLRSITIGNTPTWTGANFGDIERIKRSSFFIKRAHSNKTFFSFFFHIISLLGTSGVLSHLSNTIILL